MIVPLTFHNGSTKITAWRPYHDLPKAEVVALNSEMAALREEGGRAARR